MMCPAHDSRGFPIAHNAHNASAFHIPEAYLVMASNHNKILWD